MKRFYSFLLLALFVCVAPAHAVVVEIPLPGLLGTYPVSPSNAERTVSFSLPAVPSVIHGASIRVAGTTEIGVLNCSGGLAPWGTEVDASMTDTGTKFWHTGNSNLTAGAFGWTKPFTSVFGATWNFLLDGSGTITLYGAPLAYSCSALVSPTLNVTEAVLIVDAEFPVAVEASTWGSIKALYR